MVSFSLACYTLRVRYKGTNTYLDLGNYENGKDMLHVMGQYFGSRSAQMEIDDDAHTLLRASDIVHQNRRIKGWIETGEYGFESELLDITTQNVSYQRTLNDAEIMPFYFLIDIPGQGDEAVLALQRRAQFGIRTVLGDDLRKYFHGIEPNKIIEINPLVPEALIDQWFQNGRVTQIRFVRFAMPTDVADAFDQGGHVEDVAAAELILRAKRNQAIRMSNRIRDVMRGDRPLSGFVEIRGFDYDNVKVQLEMGGKRQTIDLSNLSNLRAYYDITSEVQLRPNGHPLFSSIDAIANDVVNSINNAIGASGRNVD